MTLRLRNASTPKSRHCAIHAAILSLACSGPALAAPGERIGARIEVEPGTSLPFIGSSAAGDFVVAWTPTRSSGVVRARRFDADGVAAGDAFVVANSEAAAGAASVAMNASGAFVIAWATPRTTVVPLVFGTVTRPGRVMARRYAPGGVPLGEAFEVSPEGDEVDVAIDDDGDIAVAWAVDSNRGTVSLFVPVGYLALRTLDLRFAGVDRIAVRRYAADGSAFAPVTIDRQIELLGRGASGVSVAMDADGDHAVVWSRRIGRERSQIVAQRFNAEGEATGDETIINSSPVTGRDTTSGPDAAMSPDGTLAVTWQPDLDFSPSASARIAVRAPDNTVRVTEFAAAAGNGELAVLPKIAIDALGNLRIAAGSSAPISSRPLQTRLFDFNGVPLTATTPVLPAPMNTSPQISAISTDGAGRSAIAHSFLPGDFTGARLSVQRFAGP